MKYLHTTQQVAGFFNKYLVNVYNANCKKYEENYQNDLSYVY